MRITVTKHGVISNVNHIRGTPYPPVEHTGVLPYDYQNGAHEWFNESQKMRDLAETNFLLWGDLYNWGDLLNENELIFFVAEIPDGLMFDLTQEYCSLCDSRRQYAYTIAKLINFWALLYPAKSGFLGKTAHKRSAVLNSYDLMYPAMAVVDQNDPAYPLRIHNKHLQKIIKLGTCT